MSSKFGRNEFNIETNGSIVNQNYTNIENNVSIENIGRSVPLRIINTKKSRSPAVEVNHEQTSSNQDANSNQNSTELPTNKNEQNYFKKSMQRNQSRKLPYPVIYLIMIITGIAYKMNDDDDKNKKCVNLKKFTKITAIISTAFYLLTICTGLTFAITNIWYLIGDSLNKGTKTTLFTRSVSILVTLIWFSMGNYAIKVLYNLFQTKDLQDFMRLKTKSYFKIPASLILLILIGIFLYTIFANIGLNESQCQQIELSVVICQLKFYFTIIFSCITIFWNYLVAFTIMIMNRTNTIYIRRFLFDLENESSKISKISYDIINKRESLVKQLSVVEIDNNESGVEIDLTQSEDHLNDIDYDDEEENTVKNANLKHENAMSNLPKSSYNDCPACLNRFLYINVNKTNDSFLTCSHIKSPNEILNEYWNIAYKLKLISNLTQRWMLSLITTILMWCLSCLIEWISNRNPGLLSVLQFILPLILLAVIFGTFAEANAEGNKITQVIHPLDERIRILEYLKQNPLQLRMYGFALDYAAEVKFIGAISIGFLSQIIYHEINT